MEYETYKKITDFTNYTLQSISTFKKLDIIAKNDKGSLEIERICKDLQEKADKSFNIKKNKRSDIEDTVNESLITSAVPIVHITNKNMHLDVPRLSLEERRNISLQPKDDNIKHIDFLRHKPTSNNLNIRRLFENTLDK